MDFFGNNRLLLFPTGLYAYIKVVKISFTTQKWEKRKTFNTIPLYPYEAVDKDRIETMIKPT